MIRQSRRSGTYQEGFSIRILIVEDETALAESLVGAVSAAGFDAETACDGEQALHLGQTKAYDAVLLDLGLPKLPGLEVLRQWRAERRTMHVIILSARGTWSERVEGLNLGADDYMAKPCHAAEVTAKLRALQRRICGSAPLVLCQGRVTVDLAAHIALLDGQNVDLTAQELKILIYMMQRPGQVIPQSDLASHVYGPSDLRGSNTIEVFIARLRAKLGRETIRTVRGLGYRMDGL